MWEERSDGGCWVWDAQNVVVSHDLQRLMEFMGVPNLKECRRRTLCYFYLEKGLAWWGGKKKKFGPFLDLCVSSLRRGHANLLCIVPILSDVSEETSFNSGVSIYEETYLVLKFRCGMGMGCQDPRLPKTMPFHSTCTAFMGVHNLKISLQETVSQRPFFYTSFMH